MTRLHKELDIYDAIHQNVVNRTLHAVGIPTIMAAVIKDQRGQVELAWVARGCERTSPRQ